MDENENERIEFFSDAVFAIATTLLILEIKVPQLHGTAAAMPPLLSAALLELYPSYFGYVFSFLMIGICWAKHYRIFKLYRRSDHIFVLLNIIFSDVHFFFAVPDRGSGGVFNARRISADSDYVLRFRRFCCLCGTAWRLWCFASV